MRKSPEPHPGFLSTELTNTATHGIGLGLSIAGLAILVVLASKYGTARHVVACSIYGGTLVTLYLASTLYHSAVDPKAKHVLRIIDHSAIYLLIAGTYTPFTLVTLKGAWGWTLFAVVWSVAILGIVSKVFLTGKLKVLSVAVYLGLGWLSVVAVKPLLATLSPAGVAWLLAGGGGLHGRGRLLRVGEDPAQPRDLARLRDDRQHLPLLFGDVLRRAARARFGHRLTGLEPRYSGLGDPPKRNPSARLASQSRLSSVARSRTSNQRPVTAGRR